VKLTKKLKKERIGESKRFNMFLPLSLLDSIEELNERARSLKFSKVLTASYVLREGGRMFIRAKNREMDLVDKAEFHAKKRKP
jgi:hypothetical protein